MIKQCETEVPSFRLFLFILAAAYQNLAQSEYHEHLYVQNFPHIMNLERWNGKHDVYRQSDSICLGSNSSDTNSNEAVTTARVRLQSYHSGKYPYGLKHSDDDKQILPIEIAFAQNSNHQKTVFEHSSHYIRIPNVQSNCAIKDFNFQVFISEKELIRFSPGEYQNHFDFFVENEEGTYLSRRFQVKLTIPRLVKIGFSGDININNKSSGGYRVGATNACVYTNDGGQYRIRAESNNFQNGSYQLCSGQKERDCEFANIPYEIRYQAYSNKSFKFNHPGHKSNSLPGSNNYFSFCTEFNANANIQAVVHDSLLHTMLSGVYSDIVTLIVEPD